MMKANTNKFFSLAIVSSLLFIPLTSLADTINIESVNLNSDQIFCSSMDSAYSQTVQISDTAQAKYAGQKLQRMKELSDRWVDRDQRREQNRDKWDSNRAAHYTRFVELATTTDQKKVVKVFKESMDTAVKVRRDSIDLAIKNYRDGVDKAINDRKSNLDSLYYAFQNAVRSSFDQAEADCLDGIETKLVRKSLKESLKNARVTFQTGIKKLDQIQKVIESLSKDRNLAINEAEKEFKKAQNTAVSVLKGEVKQSVKK